MSSYTHDYSNFPSQIMTRHEFRDADDSVATYINQIKLLQSQGKYAEAADAVRRYKDILGPYVLGSEYLNAIDEETRNIEVYAKSRNQQIYYQDDEPEEEQVINDVWLGPTVLRVNIE